MLNKKMSFLILLLVSSLSFGQSIEKSSKIVGNTAIVAESPVLTELANNVNTTYAAMSSSSTGSRTTGTQAKENYEKALDAYMKELEQQLSLGSASNEAELKEEIALTKKLKNSVSPAPATR